MRERAERRNQDSPMDAQTKKHLPEAPRRRTLAEQHPQQRHKDGSQQRPVQLAVQERLVCRERFVPELRITQVGLTYGWLVD